MASGVEVANAYVSLAISGKDVTPGVKKALGGLDGEASTAGKRVGSRMSESLKSSLKVGAGVALGAAFAGSVALIGSSISAASDLNETVSKSQVIFGKQAGAMDKWASAAVTSAGLSKQAALEAAAGFGDMFSQIGFTGDQAAKMSRKVVQMSADLGSFNNLPTAEVTDMISAAMRGEYDSLQRVIPNINAARVQQEALNRTHKDSAKDLTASEKAAATLAIIQKDGARAAGDFARTSGGLANQQKILSAQFDNAKASLGTALLPILTSVMGYITGTAVPAVSSFFDQMKANKGVPGQIGSVLKTFGTAAKAAFTFLIDHKAEVAAFIGVLGGFSILRAITGAVRGFNLALAANPMSLVVLGLAALAAGLVYAYKKSSTFRAIVQGAFSGVRTAIGWVIGAAAGLMSMFAKMLRGLSKVPGFGWARDAARAMDNAAGTARRLADNIRGIQNKSVTVTTTYRYVETGRPSKSQSLIMNGAVAGARAAGGPVTGGMTYLVGEEGPELFTPGTSGRITANHDLRAASGSAVAGMGAGGRVTLVVDGHEFSAYVDSRADGRVGAARASAARRTRARLEVL